jgi:cytochrome c biogenesis protein CcmG, thiol:disulfide interchange protein DsbE
VSEPVPQKSLKAGGWARNALWALATFAAAAAAYEGIQEAKRSRLLADGSPAPEFSLPKLRGGVESLSALRGKVVMLDFWATWCGPCAAEMPSLQKLAREYESKGLVFVAANHDESPNAPRDIAAFIPRVAPGLDPYVVFSDEATPLAYRVQALPTLYLIDRQGQVADAMEGQQLELVVRRHIEKVLGL